MSRPKKQHLKRRKDGRYCCVYKGRQFMGNSEDEAFAKRDEFKRQEAEGLFNADKTVSEYTAYWLPVYKADVKPTTYNCYVSILSTALDKIGDKRLGDVTSDHISELLASLKNRSSSYIHKTRILVRAVFQSAVDANYIRKNPCNASSVKPPKGTKGTHRAITEEERKLILTTPHRMQLPALIMLYCGLRRGEVLALEASDIHDGTVTVNKAVSFNSNRPVLDVPKTEAGRRTVPVPDVLKPHLEQIDGYIAKSASGGMMSETSFQWAWESYMKALSAAAGHPVSIRPHDLRHSYCTMLRDAGVDMHQAIIWMGHADEKMILRIYDHPGTEREKEAKNRLNEALNMRINMQSKTETANNPDT